MKHHFTLTDLVAAGTLAVLLAALIFPAVGMSRAKQRQETCTVKMKDLALAVNLYEAKYRRLPQGGHVRKLNTGPYVKDGYSFLVDLLPEMEQEELYKRIVINAQLDAENDQDELEMFERVGPNHPNEVLAVSIPMLRCPAARNGEYADAAKKQAITNYKAVSATTRAAYTVSSLEDPDKDGVDLYGIGEKRKASDGVMYIGSRTTLGAIRDGTTNTFLLAETEEPVYSRWIVGQECGLYTMTDDAQFSPARSEIPYVYPAGYSVNQYGVWSTIPADKQKTNLSRNYATSPYPWGELGFASRRYSEKPDAKTPRYGAGSSHGGVVNHAFVAGTVKPVSKNVDAAAYFFLTTRANDDPAPVEKVK